MEMRYTGMTLMASVLVLAACGGGEKAPEATSTPAATTPAATPAPATASAAAPITGKTIEVKMVGDEKGYRFEPANITAKAGDAIKFVTVSMGPHNVAFDPAKVAADIKAQLDANFGNDKMGELASGLKMNPGESFTLSLGALKPGKYEFTCTPHLAMNMKGTITIEP
jgi:plastocyanin